MIISPENMKNDKKLAINGGHEPYALPEEDTGICPEAAEAVADVVKSKRTSYWGGGPTAKKLEKRFSELIGKKDAFFHNSGSAALITGLHALGVDETKNVAISSSGFVSSINAVYHTKGRPVFLPTDENTLLCKYDVTEWVNEPIDVLLITHFFGNVVDVDPIMKCTKAKYLLEDVSQALGSKIKGQYVGAKGDVSTFAGSNRKLLGAGQGGINVYDDPEIGVKMRTISHHGKGKTQCGEVPGFNFRGGEMEATLAMASLDVMEEKAKQRINSAETFRNILKNYGIKVAEKPDVDCEAVWFDTPVILPLEWSNSRDWLVEALNMEGVPAWTYPSLIEMPWVKPWMESMGWWGEREEKLLHSEKELWNRVFVVGSQMSCEDSKKCAETLVSMLID